ncbi:peptide chain release factor N(5)-glutamine methyltransferase [Hwanghaeella grinnelliae]|uniref:Release factor glutamine methyltransferase n=1 Tax=Hwanghaeella grinnelliae TaxID=2500179 RepID=A0A3S2Z802_9PROT|nr:peptide chain release factor N(5)-glutamine methyltransferase [Hwanghaeella grinnelliae]RVU35854.1 peptide chain release factor N(5)-glutamine methyltransferase [Hwanghaeella grinnelliae]
MTTVDGFLADAARLLKEAGNQDPRREARLLLAFTEGVSGETLVAYPERELSNSDRAWTAIKRRASGEPVSRIVGRRGFWKDDFLIGPDTLDPRPDTETVIEEALDLLPDRAHVERILDLGVGSGCLLLSLLREFPAAHGVGVDISDGAVDATLSNAQEFGLDDRVQAFVGNWFAGVTGRFDLIVSNPPYIKSGDIQALDREVRDHDPMRALDGGADGLECYRAIIPAAKDALKPGGFLALEVGARQASEVSSFCVREGFSRIRVRQDLAGIERCISAQWPG